MATYVMVHGAWHGSWCWSRVADVLKANGNQVYTPTLSGLSDRAPLLSRETGLETHVEDVLAVLNAENLTDIVLVGHSYSGMVVTAVADRASDRIARLVYLDAVVPRDGDSLFDQTPAHFKARVEDQAMIAGDGWCIPVAVASPRFLGLTLDEDIRWVLPKLTPHPLRTFRDVLRLGAGLSSVPRTYINCIADKPPGQPRTAQTEGIEDYYELQTGHDAMVTAPLELAELFGKLADKCEERP